MKNIILVLFFLILSDSIYSQSVCPSIEQKIDSLIQTHLVTRGRKPVYNFLLYANNFSTGCEMKVGKGTIGRNDAAIDGDYQFNVASITKTMVAAIILQLEEEGKLNISDYAGKYLNDIEFLRFRDFHYYKKNCFSDSITVWMLLNHTSGIADIFTDASIRFNISVLLHKKRQYTPEKVISRYFRYHLNKKAFNIPGHGYHYSDINYMLLGFIIEKITNEKLHEAIRDRIITPLKLENTYFEHYEPPKGNLRRIDAFLNRINMTKKINTSYEWAGGGIVSTTRDLSTFIVNLLSGELFQNKATTKKMMDISDTQKFGHSYGLGLIRYDIDGHSFYGHGGFYGSIMVYDPETPLVFVANIGQANPPYDSGKLAADMIRIILQE